MLRIYKTRPGNIVHRLGTEKRNQRSRKKKSSLNPRKEKGNKEVSKAPRKSIIETLRR